MTSLIQRITEPDIRLKTIVDIGASGGEWSTVDGTDGKPRQVLAKTIGIIASEKKMAGPFLLKFDTHGYEIPILNNAE